MESQIPVYPAIFQPIQLGLVSKSGCFSKTTTQAPLSFTNRLVVSAMGRLRCTDDKCVPNDLMAEYYSQRASAAFVVTEATPVSKRSNTYPKSGCLYNEEQMQGWKKVVEKVHSKKGIIFCQLTHSGRQTHSKLQEGLVPWAPSAIAIRSNNKMVNEQFEVPQELTVAQIQEVIQEFKKAAELAKQAGFDGIELNAGHGFLLDQFLRDGSNKRTDEYGGSVQNRCKFPLAVINAVISVFGAGRVGVKITPVSHNGDMIDSKPVDLFSHLLRQLSSLQLAYVVLKQDEDPENHEGYGYPASKTQIPCVYGAFRQYFSGVLIGNGGINPEKADQDIRIGKYDMAAIAKLYISNPDLVERAKYGYPINLNIDWSKVFGGAAEGYTDYPTHKPVQNGNGELLKPIKIGTLELPNRIIMSAMGRLRCDDTYVPNDLLVEYYSQRAAAGLIVTESTPVSRRSNAFPKSPCIYTDEQGKGWSRVVTAVHNKGGRIFLQLFHSGRQTHSSMQNGLPLWAPSPIAIRGNNKICQKEYEIPHEMNEAEIQETIKEFVDGAKRAKTANFDGIELNAGHGFLIDQFLKDSSNKRTDKYGGSIENRCRFVLDLLKQLNGIFPGRVGIKVTPATHSGDTIDSDPVKLYTYLFSQLSQLKLAYVILKEDTDAENTDNYGYPASKVQIPDVYNILRPHYKGVLIGNNGLTIESGVNGIQKQIFDAACFGRYFITNPDLVYRIRNGLELNVAYDYSTFFGGDAKGYTDYKGYDEWIKSK